MKKLMIFIFISLFTSLDNSNAQQNSIFVKKIEKKKILKYENNKESILYESPLFKIDEIRITPSIGYISAIESSDFKIDNKIVIEYPKNRLVILTSDGRNIKYLNEDVRRYSWNPDEKRIAIITGEYREGEGEFIDEKLFIYDHTTDKIREIHDISHPRDVHWRKNGRILYIKDHRRNVYRFDTDTKKLELTDFKDFHFSPDEKYYMQFPNSLIGIENLQIYETVANQKIDRNIPEEIGEPVKWILDHEHLLLFEKKDVELTYRDPVRKNVKNSRLKDFTIRYITSRKIKSIKYSVYDVEKGEVVKQFETKGEAYGWITSSNGIVVKNEGKQLSEVIFK